MAPPPCPCPTCAPCTDRLGQAQQKEGRAGSWGAVALSFGTSLGAQFNFSRDTSAVPLPLLHSPRGASKSNGPRESSSTTALQFACRLAAIFSDPARIPWFADPSNPSQRVRPVVAHQPSSPPLTPYWEGPELLAQAGTWLHASISLAAGLRSSMSTVASFARASLVLRRLRNRSTGHAPACTSATRLTVCYMTRYETTPSRPSLST